MAPCSASGLLSAPLEDIMLMTLMLQQQQQHILMCIHMSILYVHICIHLYVCMRHA